MDETNAPQNAQKAQNIPNLSHLLTEGTLLLTLTGYVYILALKHKQGYLGFFGFPEKMVSLDMTDCLQSITALLFGGMTAFLFVNHTIEFIRDSSHGIWRKMLFAIAIPILTTLLLHQHFAISWHNALITTSAITAVLGIGILIGYLTSKYPALAKELAPPNKPSLISPMELVRKLAGRWFVFGVLTLFLLAALAEPMGRGSAARNRSFLATPQLDEVVIGRIAEGTVLASYDPKTNEFDSRFRILSSDQLSETQFSTIQIKDAKLKEADTHNPPTNP